MNPAIGARAAQVCPVGAIPPKRQGFYAPIGQCNFDIAPIGETDRSGPYKSRAQAPA